MSAPYINEIECRQCDGAGSATMHGCCGDTQHGECRGHCVIAVRLECDECNGTGWREMTADEINDHAADAFSDQCEGEPPMSFAERTEMNAKRDAQWGVK